MPMPPTPPDLQWCIRCRKVVGTPRRRGWFGAECYCDKPTGDALRGAHGAATGAITYISIKGP